LRRRQHDDFVAVPVGRLEIFGTPYRDVVRHEAGSLQLAPGTLLEFVEISLAVLEFDADGFQ
jgi:hypothetical protein